MIYAPEKLVLLGSSGMLGQELLSACRARGCSPITFADSTVLNVTDHEAVREELFAIRPSVIINATGYTNVDQAEAEHDRAAAVNHGAVANLANIAREIDATLVHYSTDYVFDGEASLPYAVDATTAPLNMYGRTKLDGERAIVESGCEYLIIRTSWLYAPHGTNFVNTILRLASERESLRVVTDQRGRPTLCADLAQITCRLLDAGARGVMHGTNEGDCSWFEFAEAIVETAGLDCRIEPTVTAEFPRPARRPRFSVLDLTEANDLIGFGRHWRDALADCIDIVLHDGDAAERRRTAVQTD